MGDHRNREHYIPLLKHDLLALLCADNSLAEAERDQLHQFGRLLTATLHYEYNQRLEELKAAYAPFDPDADTKPLVPLTADERQKRLNELYRDFNWVLERANYRRVTTAIDTVLDTA